MGRKIIKIERNCWKIFNCTLAQLAIALAIINLDYNTNILEASRISQFEENVKAVEVYKKLEKETPFGIEKIFGKCS